LSARELTELGRDGARLAQLLDPKERAALGRGWIQFHVDRACVVTIAVSEPATPFWLADQGYAATGEHLRNGEAVYQLFEKHVEEGMVELGVNGLDRAPRAHYAVFVRGAQPGDGVHIRALAPACCRAVAASGGASPYVDVYAPFENLPDRLQNATIVQTRNADRYATLFLEGRAWKTHSVSNRQPDQVVVSLGARPTELTFTWRTSPGVTASRLRLAPASRGGEEPAGGNELQRFEGTSWDVRCDNLLNDPLVRRHCVLAKGLSPDARYAYSVGDGTPDGWSPWRAIATGHSESRSFRFLYLGDAQTGFEAWGKRLERAYQRVPDAAFLMLAGDLVDRGNERSNWDHFFLRARNVFERLPLMPAVGNHEYLDRGPYLYRSFFALPSNGLEAMPRNLVYSFSYGDAVFAVLDSTCALYDAEIARAQAAWLRQTFSARSAAWKIVMFHHPLYASHPNRESPELRDAWVPVFDEEHVDLVLQGHDHAYLRTCPLVDGERVDASEWGTVYVVSVSGDKYYDQAQRTYIARGLTHTSTYQVIEVDRTRLSYAAYDDSGREVDAFVLEKPYAKRDRELVKARASDR
jgi:hypothetical protein